MSLFSALNTGVSGMRASRTKLSTAGHNISNVDNDFYTRQRVTTSAVYSGDGPLNIGYGTKVDNIIRLHDEFVYRRFKTASGNLEYSSFAKRTLEEAGEYFQDLKKVGIKEDIANYFTAWNNFASNTDEGAQKTNLITQAQTLTNDIQDAREKLRKLQSSINEQIKINVDELNRMGEHISKLNKEIARIEAVEPTVANDLRDQRDELELAMAKLININVFKGRFDSDTTVDSRLTDGGTMYNLNIAGFSFINGPTFNPISIDNLKNPSNFYSIYAERKDGLRTDLTQAFVGGKIGAMLDLRGRHMDINQKEGLPSDGVLQGYIDDLDTLAKTFILQTNTIYANAAQEGMYSRPNEDLKPNTFLTSYDRDIKKGSFDVVVYDTKGNEVAKKTIKISDTTTMNDTKFGNSIVGDFNDNSDDNDDKDTTNDVDDYFLAQFKYSPKDGMGVLEFKPKTKDGYTIAIKDNGTNFAGVIGMSRFFDGNSAKDISVESSLVENPGSLHGYSAPLAGNNETANAMVELQYEKVEFNRSNFTQSNETIEGFYRFITATISSNAEQAGFNDDANKAIFQTINEQFQSISGVSLDEELSDLMKFQTAYSANAKVLTTVDKMLDALLGIR